MLVMMVFKLLFKLPGVLSRIGTVPAGVPQGGVISPTLFNVYISDIQDYIHSEIPITMCKYADDCRPVANMNSYLMVQIVKCRKQLITWKIGQPIIKWN